VRVLFATIPIGGHVQPLLGLARALAARGHELRWHTGRKYRTAVENAGAVHEPYVSAPDFDDHDMAASFPEREQLRGLAQLKYDLVQVFGASALGQLDDLSRIARDFAPHLMISEPCTLGPLLLKERTGIPLIFINVVACTVRSRDTAPFGLGILPGDGLLSRLRNRALYALVAHVLMVDAQQHWVRIRESAGLPTHTFLLDAPLGATLLVQPTVQGFEYPRSDLPAHVRFVGALASDPPAETRPLEGLSGRPIVHVTQGTMSNVRPALIQPALEGLAREDVQVIVATGGRTAQELGLHHVPSNALILPYVSYPQLLPQTSVMVTNGGYGGVQLALSHGVPLVVWGTSEDKPEVAARVAWSGAGVRLRGLGAPSPTGVRSAVRKVLDEPCYRMRARELAQQYAAQDATAGVVALAEGLLAGS
jgi:MGT family glycosyltransferase